MRYEAGSKKAAIEELIRCAIQDRNSLIECHLHYNAATGEMVPVASDSEETIADCADCYNETNYRNRKMKSNEYWALYNFANLWVVEKTQRACKEEAENVTGVSWDKCKRYFKIVKVEVSPVGL